MTGKELALAPRRTGPTRPILRTPCYVCGRLPVGTFEDGLIATTMAIAPTASRGRPAKSLAPMPQGLRICPVCPHEHFDDPEPS